MTISLKRFVSNYTKKLRRFYRLQITTECKIFDIIINFRRKRATSLSSTETWFFCHQPLTHGRHKYYYSPGYVYCIRSIRYQSKSPANKFFIQPLYFECKTPVSYGRKGLQVLLPILRPLSKFHKDQWRLRLTVLPRSSIQKRGLSSQISSQAEKDIRGQGGKRERKIVDSRENDWKMYGRKQSIVKPDWMKQSKKECNQTGYERQERGRWTSIAPHSKVPAPQLPAAGGAL